MSESALRTHSRITHSLTTACFSSFLLSVECQRTLMICFRKTLHDTLHPFRKSYHFVGVLLILMSFSVNSLLKELKEALEWVVSRLQVLIALFGIIFFIVANMILMSKIEILLAIKNDLWKNIKEVETRELLLSLEVHDFLILLSIPS